MINPYTFKITHNTSCNAQTDFNNGIYALQCKSVYGNTETVNSININFVSEGIKASIKNIVVNFSKSTTSTTKLVSPLFNLEKKILTLKSGNTIIAENIVLAKDTAVANTYIAKNCKFSNADWSGTRNLTLEITS